MQDASRQAMERKKEGAKGNSTKLNARRASLREMYGVVSIEGGLGLDQQSECAEGNNSQVSRCKYRKRESGNEFWSVELN